MQHLIGSKSPLRSALAAILALLVLSASSTAGAIALYHSEGNDGAVSSPARISGWTVVHFYFDNGSTAPVGGLECQSASGGDEICQWGVELRVSGNVRFASILWQGDVISSPVNDSVFLAQTPVSGTGGDVTGDVGPTKVATIVLHGTFGELRAFTPAGFGFLDRNGTLLQAPAQGALLAEADPIDWVLTSTRGTHTCSLVSNGEVFCFGDPTGSRTLGAEGAFRQVSVGGSHACALGYDRKVACWGVTPPPPSPEYLEIAAATAFTCGLLPTLEIECWGASPPGSIPPGPFRQVSRGGTFACGLRLDGQIRCFGSGGFGILTPPSGTFVDISGGLEHACALDAAGHASCWGNPADQRTNAGAGVFARISAGGDHTCGILASDGSLYCFGDDTQGEVSSAPAGGGFVQVSAGVGLTCGVRSNGTQVCWGTGQSGSDAPPQVAFPQVTAGGGHSCAVGPGRKVRCWGDDTDGQATAPSPASSDFTQISAGASHTCSTNEGDESCWGLGASSYTDAALLLAIADSGADHTCWFAVGPTAVCKGSNSQGQLDAPEGPYAQVTAGYEFSCGVLDTGLARCWGDDAFGKDAPPLNRYKQISAGGQHACAVRTDRSLACWGRSDEGQLDAPPGSFRQVAAGGDFLTGHGCAVRNDGRILCWGDDGLGQASPPPKGDFVEVSTGVAHSCGVYENGSIACWGSDAASVSQPPLDTDGDGLEDPADNCPTTQNFDQADGDADAAGDACDVCIATFDPDQWDRDGDGVGDACDNCKSVSNPRNVGPFDCNGDNDTDDVGEGDGEQCDVDDNGVGDACEVVSVIVRPEAGAAGGMGSAPFLAFAPMSTEDGTAATGLLSPMLQASSPLAYDLFIDCGAFEIARLDVGLIIASDVNVGDLNIGQTCQSQSSGGCGDAGGIGDSVNGSASFVEGPGLTGTGLRADTAYLTLVGNIAPQGLLCTPTDAEERMLVHVELGTPATTTAPALTTEGVATPLTDVNSNPVDVEDVAFVAGPSGGASSGQLKIGPATVNPDGDRWEITFLSPSAYSRVSFGIVARAGIAFTEMRYLGCETPAGVPLTRRNCAGAPEFGAYASTVPGESFTLGPAPVVPTGQRDDTLYVSLAGSLFVDPDFNLAVNPPGAEVSLGVVEILGGGSPPSLTTDGLQLALGGVGVTSSYVLADPLQPPVDPGTVTFLGGNAPPDDFDGDFRNDDVDNCEFKPNNDQLDRGGLLLEVPDNIGDTCQCGELENNAHIFEAPAAQGDDPAQVQRILRGDDLGAGPLERCSVSGGTGCDVLDWVILKRALAGAPGPGISAVCGAAVQHSSANDN